MLLANTTRQPNVLFSLCMLLFVGGLIPLTIVMTKRQRRYLRSYREQRKINLKLSDELRSDYRWESITEMYTNSLLILKAYRTPQPEPDLEQERRDIIQIHRIQIGWFIVGSALIVVAGLITS